MKKTFAILVSMLLICMVGLASADVENGNPDINVEITPYIATETVDDETGEITVTEDWGNTIEYSMELEDNLGDVDVDFYDFNEDTEIIKLKINGNKWFAEEGEEKIVYGTDATLNAGDFKIELSDVYFYASITDNNDDDGVFGVTDDVPVEVYIQLSNGETKTLGQLDDLDETADKVNLETYSKDDWFDSNVDTDDMKLFIERIDNDATINKVKLNSEDADFDNYDRVTNNDNLIFFTLDENGHYELTIQYEESKLWGDEDKTEVYYKLDVIGLDKDGDGVEVEEGEVLFTESRTLQQGNGWTKNIAVDGEWTDLGGMTVVKTENGETFDYRFTGQMAGTYTAKFTSVDGDTGEITFTINAKPVSNNNVQTNNTNSGSNNNQGTTANQSWVDDLTGNNAVLIGIIIFSIIGILFIFGRGGKGNTGGNGGASAGSLIDKNESILSSGKDE